MSAFDPKRTLGSLRLDLNLLGSQPNWRRPKTSGMVTCAPARFHKSCCGLSNRLAVHGACARAHTVSRPPQHPRRGRSRITVTNCSVQKSLQELGWTDGSIRIEARWAGGDVERLRKHAKELVALGPDVILTSGSVTVRPLQQATRTIPIVFVQAVDPVGSGYVESMSRPGGNTTGFTQFEYSLSGKWLELLKQIAPQVTRVAVVRDPVNGSGIAQFAVIQAFAPPLGVELIPIDARDVREIDRGITPFSRFDNGGLIVTSGGTGYHRDVIIPLAVRFRLPAVYPYRYYATDGGLASYGPNTINW